MSETTDQPRTKVEPALKLRFLSHGTLESADIDRTRRFYEEFMGFETVRSSPMSMWIRLGGEHIYVVVPKEAGRPPMSVRNHNGIDVDTEAQVNEAHQVVVRDAEKWGLHQITRPTVQHGTYSFYFWDGDENCWEILCNPKGGYSWMFERGDQGGRGHLDKSFARPTLTPSDAQ
jgi:catechol 2,3-dioxygenase-like lactoylglutathione lyase family enzyme